MVIDLKCHLAVTLYPILVFCDKNQDTLHLNMNVQNGGGLTLGWMDGWVINEVMLQGLKAKETIQL